MLRTRWSGVRIQEAKRPGPEFKHLHLLRGLRMGGAIPPLPLVCFVDWIGKILPLCDVSFNVRPPRFEIKYWVQARSHLAAD
jgi:hypothetical protein